jgi:hypothetical protein
VRHYITIPTGLVDAYDVFARAGDTGALKVVLNR